jgi:hypothetical protein
MKRALLIIGLILSLCVFSAPVLAAVWLDFSPGDAGQAGTLHYDGVNVTGTDIPLDVLSVSGAGLNNGVWDLSGALGGPPGETFAALNFDTSSGNITVEGGVPGLGINDGTLLLRGTITSSQASLVPAYPNGPSLLLLVIQGNDEKDKDLLKSLGLAEGTPFTFLGFNIGGSFQLGGQDYLALSTDLTNTPVPIPSAILLLGGGLAGLAVLRRRIGV